MSVKTFENNGKNIICENFAELKLEQNIESLMYNHLVYIRLGLCHHEITQIMQFVETSF